jgi:hypothetical protein
VLLSEEKINVNVFFAYDFLEQREKQFHRQKQGDDENSYCETIHSKEHCEFVIMENKAFIG